MKAIKRFYYKLVIIMILFILFSRSAVCQQDINIKISQTTLNEALATLVEARAINFGDYTGKWISTGWFVNLDAATITLGSNNSATINGSIVWTEENVLDFINNITVHADVQITGNIELLAVGSTGYQIRFLPKKATTSNVTGAWPFNSLFQRAANLGDEVFIYFCPPIELNSGTQLLPSAVTSYFTSTIPSLSTLLTPTENYIVLSYSVAGDREITIQNDLGGNHLIGTVQSLEGSSWSSYNSPYTAWWAINSTHSVRVPTTSINNSGQWWRFRLWEDDNNFSLQENITVINDQTFNAQFLQAQPVTLQASLEGTITNYIPMTFFNQAVTTPYSDYAFMPPNNIPISTASTENVYPHIYNFFGWSDGNTSLSRPISPSQPTTYTANYKAHLASNNSSATGSSSQRKFFYDNYSSAYYMVYESMGKIWFTKSTDGVTWTQETLISDGLGNAKNPSFVKNETTDNYNYILWTDKSYNNLGTGYDIYERKINLQTGQLSSISVVFSASQNYGYARQNANPSGLMIALQNSHGGYYTSLFVTFEGSNGIQYSYRYIRPEGDTVWTLDNIPNTTSSFLRPSSADYYDSNYQQNIALTCDDGSNVYYFPSGPFAIGPSFTNSTRVLISDNSNYTNNHNASVITDYGNRVQISWTGDQGQSVFHRCIYNGTLYPMDRFIDDLGWDGVSPILSSTSAHFIDNGFTTLITDGSNAMYNYYTTGGTNWQNWKSQIFGNNINYPSSDFNIFSLQLASAITNLTAPPYGISFAYGNKTGALKVPVNQNSNITMNHYRQVTLIDTIKNAYLQIQFSNLVFPDRSSTDPDSIEFVNDSTNDYANNPDSFLRSRNFYADAGNIKFDIKVINKNWNQNSSAEISLLDSATGKIIFNLIDIPSLTSYSNNNSYHEFNANYIGSAKKVYLQINLSSPGLSNYIKHFENVFVLSDSINKNSNPNGGDNSLLTANAISQNYPNPFNPTTVISYQIPNDGYVSLKVFDALGREVRTLVNEYKSQGKYSVNFDAGNLSSGVYFYQLKNGNYTSIKKMILLK